ncbi:formate hydrogenlyase [Rhodanobacter sp. Root627]|uniref:NADH-quinone oxidoreductase subunit B family protein n=1 Tax=Rhodanobacter sp. Root627 TaxID=1736572 RepID=UPI0006FCB1C5|nr:formate hydrogenlyase [Rhodanobacter sp. Root627]KRA35506.1 formate hydrogenlyase [Rhodanobacter sp. Root627]
MFDILSRIRRVGRLSEPLPARDTSDTELTAIQRELHNVFGRALCIRHVDAGSCNGCELEIHALSNPYYNLEGAGIRFVASPRHADLLLVTGPVSVNMEDALKHTYEAMPEPKWVLAVGDCGACGGIFGANYAVRGPISDVIPVHAVVNGCPPSPLAILRGLLHITRHLPS